MKDKNLRVKLESKPLREEMARILKESKIVGEVLNRVLWSHIEDNKRTGKGDTSPPHLSTPPYKINDSCRVSPGHAYLLELFKVIP